MSDELQMVSFVLAIEALGVFTFKRWLGNLQPVRWRQHVAWTILIIAGLTEIVWLVALKNSNGFVNTGQGLFSIAVSWLSFFMLAYALRSIPAGTAYAVWTGCGAAGGALAGMLLFGEQRSAIRLGSIALIVVGIVGVKMADSLPAGSE
jgi:quaternary ammonium compound-resistance protein SugE